MFHVEGSLEEFETYEEAVDELYAIMEVYEILEFMDCTCVDILSRFLKRKNITDFEVWLSEKVNEAITRMENDLIIEYEEDE